MPLKALAHSKSPPLNRQVIAPFQEGFSLVELLIVLGISAIILTALSGVVSQALDTERIVRSHNDTHQQARFAMQQLIQAVERSERLILPLPDNPATSWNESVRNPGVLAVTLDPTQDKDRDGWADANNDKDYLDINNNGVRDTGEPERIDEDFWHDMSNDKAAGIVGIDDDNDGLIDEGDETDDDEDGTTNEDGAGKGDEDNDGATDEDMSFDNNGDKKAGVANFDDDYDGDIDEGKIDDDDEDGSSSEDWCDLLVFFLNGSTLLQRIPNINPVSGNDFTEYPIAENVSQFRVARIAQGNGRAILVELSLTLLDTDGETVQLNTQVRIGADL